MGLSCVELDAEMMIGMNERMHTSESLREFRLLLQFFKLLLKHRNLVAVLLLKRRNLLIVFLLAAIELSYGIPTYTRSDQTLESSG